MSAVDPARGTVTLQTDAGLTCQIGGRYAADRPEHGYTLTGHAAQGASVERAFVLVRGEGALAEWGYVAASRARAERRLYAVGPDLDGDATVPRDPPEPAMRSLVGALSRTTADLAATERLRRARRAPSPTQIARQRLEHEIALRERLLASTRERLEGSRLGGPPSFGP